MINFYGRMRKSRAFTMYAHHLGTGMWDEVSIMPDGWQKGVPAADVLVSLADYLTAKLRMRMHVTHKISGVGITDTVRVADIYEASTPSA